MAVASDSYCEAADVAADVPAYTASGVFSPATNPTLATVEDWIDEVSDAINVHLEMYGLDVPATGYLATAFARYVRREVADRVRLTRPNADRRPRTGQQQGGISRPFDAAEAAAKLIKQYAWGQATLADSIDYRGTDEAGDETNPIFQRKAFGNTFINWDED